MKLKKIVGALGVLMTVTAVGCGSSDNTAKNDITNSPSETVTKGPLSGVEEDVPGGIEITKPVQEEEFSYELQYSLKEESEEEKDGEFVYFKSAINYPVFEGKYAENMNRFVASLTEGVREELFTARDNAKFDYEESKNDEYRIAMFPEEEEYIVSCIRNKEQYYTLFTKWFSYSGGAHPNTFCKAYVVDVTKGEEESFENMIRPYGVSVEEVVEFAMTRIQSEHGDELFETDDESALKEWIHMFTQENQWYLNDKGLVLFANPYDIAAYAYGMIECEISYEELEQGLKK
ncbi:MAG: DUF3298 and DUF4163 domain-containing protein [Lachnospiraceae bacterium]|nr:DUF3298 and DUF4163 domain-containing protein [Lachnospiraceae bacterium]